MWYLIIVSFIMGTHNHNTDGVSTAITSAQFTTEEACNIAATVIHGDSQMGGDPYALIRENTYCVQSDGKLKPKM